MNARWTYTAKAYRFGYQGSEQDKELLGGSAYTTYFRALDVRLGRWFTPDVVIERRPRASTTLSARAGAVCYF